LIPKNTSFFFFFFFFFFLNCIAVLDLIFLEIREIVDRELDLEVQKKSGWCM
jgi:hypothetical protein